MKAYLSLFIVFIGLTSAAQNFEFYGGPVKNILHDYNKDDNHFNSSYNPDLGYAFGVALDSVRLDTLFFRFSLQFEHYSGYVKASDGGLGGRSTVNLNFNKSLISLGIFPLNFRIIQRIDLNIGFELSVMVQESFSGTMSGWSMNNPSWSYDLKERYSQYNNRVYFGFKGRLAYDFKVSESIWLSPVYMYYFGMSREFDEFPKDARSMRHYFCVSLKLI
jgi:hypothetical protein